MQIATECRQAALRHRDAAHYVSDRTVAEWLDALAEELEARAAARDERREQ